MTADERARILSALRARIQKHRDAMTGNTPTFVGFDTPEYEERCARWDETERIYDSIRRMFPRGDCMTADEARAVNGVLDDAEALETAADVLLYEIDKPGYSDAGREHLRVVHRFLRTLRGGR